MKYLMFVLTLLTSSLTAQVYVEGKITDENSEVLIGATVVLLEPKDSSMVAFSISDNNGNFHLEDIEEGPQILQVSFVSYGTIFKDVEIKSEDKNQNIGTFLLSPVSEILQEVTVKAEHIPMGLIGDTISYNAAAFQVKPGASVEDLLKRLPGVEVQRDGSIKAMGEDVENVLVDGKEFFGNDPTIATRNLDAEAVDKVQVFDKQSEIAEFTGIEDGDDEKTINLKLKDGYKSGGFGSIEGGIANKSNYKGKLNYNRFSQKMQAAIILGSNNINEQAFSFNEYIQFMGGIGNAFSANNGMFNFGGFGRQSAPRGITDNISSGLNFNYDFSNKLQLTSHYFFNRSDKELVTTTTSDQFTEASSFNTKDINDTDQLNQNHRLQAKLEYKINPFTQLIWKNTVSGIFSDAETQATTIFSEGSINSGQTRSDFLNSENQKGFEGKLQYRKRFKKKGRNWISSIDYQKGILDQDNNILNEYLFQNNISTINQFQDYSYKKDAIKLNTSFTEPLGKQHYLGLQLDHRREIENPDKLFYDIFNEDLTLNEILSADYKKTNTINKASISLKKNAKRYKLNTAIGTQWTRIRGEIQQELNSGNAQNITNESLYILPSISLEVDLTKDKEIDLFYRTSINLPTLSQLAPLPENDNPNILINGNPDLVPEYIHTLGLHYSLLDMFNFKNLFIQANVNIIQNQIINELSIDNQFIKTLTPNNSETFRQYSGYASYSAPIRPLKLKFRTTANYSFVSYKSLLNELPSDVTESNINFSLILDNRSKEHVDISSGISLDYNIRRYDINSSFDQNFFNYKLFVDGIFYLGKDWTLSTKFDYVSYSGAFFSDNQKYNLWNASIRKSFKEEKFSISISAFDILNENIGLERSGGVNALYESRYNTLSQYFMVSLKMKLGKKKKKEGMHFG